ncbi:Fc.00g056700.m01.CDS01 [Cosmosporella sp. VM-42]
MVSFNYVTILAALYAVGVAAGPCKPGQSPPATTTLATLVKPVSSTISSIAASAPTLGSETQVLCAAAYLRSKDICNVKGNIGNPAPRIDSNEISFQECASSCAESSVCTSIFYQNGLCTRYSGSFSDLGFQEANSEGFWYESSCFQCSRGKSPDHYDCVCPRQANKRSLGELILDLDFEDGDVSNWSLEDTPDYSVYLDIQTPYDGRGGTTKALRLFEGEDSGTGQAKYIPEFTLEDRETYMLYASVRNTAQWSPTSSSGWENIKLTLMNGDLNLFEDLNVEGSALGGNNWIQWSALFEVQEGQGGSVSFGIDIQVSGRLLDYYFDDIKIFKI